LPIIELTQNIKRKAEYKTVTCTNTCIKRKKNNEKEDELNNNI